MFRVDRTTSAPIAPAGRNSIRQISRGRGVVVRRTIEVWFIAVVVASAVMVGAPPADAHEIAIAVSVPATRDGLVADRSEFLDGLRLAIDQSPDVGHPPGPASGDHLGGVDLKLVHLGSDVGDETDRALGSAVAAGATMFVVVGARAATAAAHRLVDEPVLLIALLDSESLPQVRPEAMIALRPGLDASPDQSLVREFEAAFVATYGRSPAVGAALGYDVGRFLDVVIAETDGFIPNTAELENLEPAATARLVATSFEVILKPTATLDEGLAVGLLEADVHRDSERGQRGFWWPAVLLVGLAAVIAVERFIHRH